jgi:signal transduction histidine kinase
LLQILLRSVQRSDVKREPVADIGGFLAEHAALFREQAARRTITVDCQRALAGNAVFDKTQIGRALDNLILNAIQNSDDGTPIVLRAETTGSNLRLSIEDAGHGVPVTIREHLFEPFTTGRPDGTGLGLAIVREIAEAHGGRVSLEHRGDGTTFTLELPAGERA